MRDLESRLREAEARTLAAEVRADEGAVALREKLMQAKESHAAVIMQERSESKRHWKSRVRELQDGLRGEMENLAAMQRSTTTTTTRLLSGAPLDRARLEHRSTIGGVGGGGMGGGLSIPSSRHGSQPPSPPYGETSEAPSEIGDSDLTTSGGAAIFGKAERDEPSPTS